MSDIHTFSLLGSVLATSIWSLVCLKKTDPVPAEDLRRSGAHFLFSESRIAQGGSLSSDAALELLKAADL